MRAIAVLVLLTAAAHADDLSSLIEPHQAEIQACAASQPKLRGKLFVYLEIQPKGNVSGQFVAGSTLRSPEIEKCALDTVGKWTFPSGKKKRRAVHPFVFAGDPAPQASVSVEGSASDLLHSILKRDKSGGPCWIAVDESMSGATDLAIGDVKGAFFCNAAIAKALQEKRAAIIETLFMGDHVSAAIRLLSHFGLKQAMPIMGGTGGGGPARDFLKVVLQMRAEQGQLLLIEVTPTKENPFRQ